MFIHYHGVHITMCLRVLRDALVSHATASERAMVRANHGVSLHKFRMTIVFVKCGVLLLWRTVQVARNRFLYVRVLNF